MTTRNYLEWIDVTPGSYVATCAGCGQEDGPFRNCRLAERCPERLGWRRVPTVESWSAEGRWLDTVQREWRCLHCLPTWNVALFRRQQEFLGALFPAALRRRSPFIPWGVV